MSLFKTLKTQIFKYIFFIVAFSVLIKSNPLISDIIINDLRNAFKLIANDTQKLNSLLQKMYDLQNSTPVVVFNMPMTNGCTKKLKMQRRSFMAPIFPNLTESYMQQMKKKYQHITDQQADQWSILGLDGWTGKLKKIADKNNQRDNFDELEYPETDILKALNQEHVVSSTSTTIATTEDWHSKNVYIARANNPFGYSTKWQQNDNFNTSQGEEGQEERTKRDVASLYSMIKCATGCNPLIYQGHGCFCGFLGTGVPEDAVDRCCQRHDKCYAQSNCINFIEYFVPYIWKCYRGKPVCAFVHGAWGGENSCAGRLCHCDLQLAICLRQHLCPQRRAVCTSSKARRLQNFLFV